MNPARLLFLVIVVGLVLGMAAGRRSYGALADPRPTCGTCHHTLSQADPDDAGAEAPHRTELGVGCHRCHVVPLAEYTVALAAEVGVDARTWVEGWEDPTVGGQTCLGCHVGRGRGALDCDRCHRDGELRPDLTQGCPACHAEQPMHPHAEQPCRVCHVESTLGHRARTEALMHEKLFDGEGSEP